MLSFFFPLVGDFSWTQLCPFIFTKLVKSRQKTVITESGAEQRHRGDRKDAILSGRTAYARTVQLDSRPSQETGTDSFSVVCLFLSYMHRLSFPSSSLRVSSSPGVCISFSHFPISGSLVISVFLITLLCMSTVSECQSGHKTDRQPCRTYDVHAAACACQYSYTECDYILVLNVLCPFSWSLTLVGNALVVYWGKK